MNVPLIELTKSKTASPNIVEYNAIQNRSTVGYIKTYV